MSEQAKKLLKKQFGRKLAYLIAVWRKLDAWAKENDIDVSQIE